MVTFSQVQRGLTMFVDRHIANAYNGIEKAIVLGGATLLAASIPNLAASYLSNPMLSAMRVLDIENCTVDIDAVYNAFVPHMGAEKLPVTLPKIGRIDLGTIKLGREDIDILVRYIREATP